MELVRSFQTVSRDCLETPDGHQTGATQADTQGRGDRIFALQASDLASLTPLQPSFQTVSLETVWKIALGVLDCLNLGSQAPKTGLICPFVGSRASVLGSVEDFQTVSKKLFGK